MDHGHKIRWFTVYRLAYFVRIYNLITHLIWVLILIQLHVIMHIKINYMHVEFTPWPWRWPHAYFRSSLLKKRYVINKLMRTVRIALTSFKLWASKLRCKFERTTMCQKKQKILWVLKFGTTLFMSLRFIYVLVIYFFL